MRKMMTSAASMALSATIGAIPVLASSPHPQDQVPERDKVVPTLTVRGQAHVEKPADQVKIGLGVVSESSDAQEAIDLNSRKMNDVIAALEEAGLTKDDYETGRFQVSPMYSHPGRGGGTPQISRYSVTNQIMIETGKLEKAGDYIAAATEAGANSVDYVQFDLEDPRKHRDEAIRDATGDARNDATVLSEAAGVRLKRVISITLDDSGWQPIYRGHEIMRAGVAQADVTPPPLSPGNITVSANVTIVYEIEQVE